MNELKDINVIETCDLPDGFGKYAKMSTSLAKVIRTLAVASPDEDLDIYAGSLFSSYYLAIGSGPKKKGCPYLGCHSAKISDPGGIEWFKIFNVYCNDKLPRHLIVAKTASGRQGAVVIREKA